MWVDFTNCVCVSGFHNNSSIKAPRDHFHASVSLPILHKKLLNAELTKNRTVAACTPSSVIQDGAAIRDPRIVLDV